MSDPSTALEVLGIFRSAGALLEDDHFVYVSGDHGSGWVAKDLLFPDTAAPSRLGELLAARVEQLGWKPALVCGPATGGLIAAQWSAHHLGVRAIYSEHDPGQPGTSGRFVLRRGFDRMVRDQPVLALDDIVNTGHSIRQTIDALRAAGAMVVGAATWVTRGNVWAEDLGVAQFDYLAQVDIPSWPADQCLLCRQGVPINVEFAHGAEYMASRRLS
jgi:orotate phosphoribosyltransferase